MFKKSIAIASTLATLMIAVPVFAQTTNGIGSASSGAGAGKVSVQDMSLTNRGTSTAFDATKVACIGAAVNARETALDAGVATHTQAVQAAYTARATALKQAYMGTTMAQIKASVKVAWSAFKTSIKSAAGTWKTTQTDAWSTFKIAAKACRAQAGLSDSDNSSSEVNGR